MTTNVKGLDRLIRQMKALPELVSEAAADQLHANAETLAGKIKAAAPRSTKDHQHMADGIKASPASTDGDAARAAKSRRGLAWKVSAPLPARWVEFGTRASASGRIKDAQGKTRTNKRGHHATVRHPFFWPTVRAWRRPLRSVLARAIGQAAKAAAKQG